MVIIIFIFVFVIVLLAIIFSVNYFLKRVFKKENHKIKSVTKIMAVTLSAVIILPICFHIYHLSYYPQRAFNSKEWIYDFSSRKNMCDDLINSKLLIGKTKEEVIGILGEDYNKYSETQIVYNIGFILPSFLIDPYVLVIIFDNNSVVKVDINQT